MARISTYRKDLVVTKQDKVIGTDATGSVTKNYTLENKSLFMSQRGLVSIGGQVMYKFASAQGPGIFTGVAGNTAFSSVSSLKFNKIDQAEDNIEDFIEEYAGNKIIISQVDDKNNYGIFTVSSVSRQSGTDIFIFSLTPESVNGNLTIEKYYVISFAGAGDKHHVHDQDQASANWIISHNMGKFPAVHIVLSTGDYGFGEVTYTDKNNLTISLGYAVAGKAYLN